MMTRRIIVKPVSGGFELRTERGFVLGPRLYSIKPEKGFDWPTIPEEPIAVESEARKIALDWNLYFAWVQTKTPKKPERIAD